MLNLEISPLWRWAIGWAVVVMLLSVVPYLLALGLTPPGWHFAGFLVNPYDGHSYLAKMRQGFEGDWLFHLAYTPEPHEGAFIFTFYLALGHLARLTGLPLIIVFHLTRLAAGFILLLTAFRFVCLVTPHAQERRLAFMLLCTASGLGWLGAMFNAFPIDLWVPEAFVPYSLFANPHFPLAIALMLVILQIVIQPRREERGETNILLPSPRLASLLSTALAGLALALILPFALLTMWAILVVYLGWRFYAIRNTHYIMPEIWQTLAVILASAPVIGYDYWVSTHNPVLAGWSAQNLTPAPSVLNLAWGYGLVGLLAIVGGWLIVRRGLKTETTGEGLVLLWAVTTLLLVYFPFFDLQRRLINGLHIPLCILAAIGLTRWLNGRIKPHYGRLITNLVVTSGALGTLFVWGLPLLGLLQSPIRSETSALFFYRDSESAAFDWLRENIKPNDLILASPRLGMFVPGQTGGRVFYGHPFETIQAKNKKAMVEAFYRGELDTLSPLPDYIIYGPAEQAVGRPNSLSKYPIVFTAQDIVVYQVIK